MGACGNVHLSLLPSRLHGATLGATLRGQRCGLHLIIVYDHKRPLVSRNNYVGNKDGATEQTGQDDMVSMRG